MRIRDNYPDYDLRPLPSVIEFDWVSQVAETFTFIFNDIAKRCVSTDGIYFDELTELVYKAITVSPLDPLEDLDLQADTITRHRTKLTSLTLQSLKKMTAMIEDVHKPPVKLAHGHYDSLEDMRLEADIDRERISVEASRYKEVEAKLTVHTEGVNHRRFELDSSELEPALKKLFFKPKHVFRVYFLLPGEAEWRLGHFMYIDCKLLFAPTLSELANDYSNYEHFYSLNLCKVELHERPFAFISCKRECDVSPLKLALGFSHPHKSSHLESKSISGGLEFLFYSLAVAAQRDISSDETEVLESCGLACLSFRSIRIKYFSEGWPDKAKDHQLFLNIRSYPYNEFVRLSLDDSGSAERHVFLPINNWFRKVEFTLLVAKSHSALLSGKCTAYGTCSLLNYDMLISNVGESKKLTEEVMLDASEKNVKEASLDFRFTNLSNFKKYFVDPNKHSYLEGKKMVRDNFSFAKTEFKIAVFRTRRFFCLLEIWIGLVLEVFRFKYQKWSVFCIAVFHVLVLLADFNKVHLLFLYLLLFAILVNSKRSTNFIHDNVFSELRSAKDLNPYYREPLVHTKHYLKTHRFLQIELLRKKLKPPEGIVSDLKLIKMGFNSAPFILHNLVNLAEKIKNLIIWYDQERTRLLMYGLIAAIIVCHLVAFKAILICCFWAAIANQRSHYKKHLDRNTEIVHLVLKQILVKFIDKYANMKFADCFTFLSNENEFSNFRKKLIPRIDRHLDIELPDNLVRAMTKMDDLVNLIAGTNERLKVLEPEALDIAADRFVVKKKTSFSFSLKAFIQSTPTDFFDIIYNS